MKWTEEEIDLLFIWIEQRWSHKDIANELGRSTGSIKAKCYELRLINNRNKVKTTKEYKEELKIKCPTIECIGDYINAKTPILHKCLGCGEEHRALPSNKVKGIGHCGSGTGRMDMDKECKVYLIYLKKHNLYKYGVTTMQLDARVNSMGVRRKDYETILLLKFSTAREALALEEQWSNSLHPHKINLGVIHGGNTETFRF